MKSIFGLIQNNKKKFWISLILFLFYFSIFNSLTANFLAKKITPINFKFKIQSISLFFGIEIDNLEIYSLNKSNFPEKVFGADQLKFKYNLWKLLFGKISIDEISLQNPKLFIEKKNETLNLETLFPKSEKIEEEKKVTLDKINTYLPFLISVFFQIKNLEILYSDNKQNVRLNNLDLDFKFDSEKFSEIQLNTEILKLVHRLDFNLNSNRKVQLEFNSKELNLKREIDLKLILNFLQNENSNLVLRFGDENFYFEKSGEKIPLSFLMESEIFSNDKENLEMKNFKIILEGKKIFDLTGKFNLNKFDYEVSLNQSELDFSAVNKILSNFFKQDIFGKLQINKSTIYGNFEEINFDVNLKLSQFIYKLDKKNHKIPSLVLNSKINLKKKYKENLIPYLKKAEINSNFIYNQMKFALETDFELDKKVSTKLDLYSFELNTIIDSIKGKVSGKLNLEGKNFNEINLTSSLNLKDFEYTIQNSKSSLSNLLLNFNSKIILEEKFNLKCIQIEKFNLNYKNKNFEEVAKIESILEIQFSEKIVFNFKKISLNHYFNKLLTTLPIYLKEKLFPIKSILGEEQNFIGNIQIEKSNLDYKLISNMDIGLSGLNIKNGKAIFNLEFLNEKKILNINKLDLILFSNVLRFSSSGSIFLNPIPTEKTIYGIKPNLKGNLSLISKEPKEILKGYLFNGDFKVNYLAKDSIFESKLFSSSSNLFYSKGICNEDNLKNCKIFYLNGIDFDIDLKHDFDPNLKFVKLAGSKSKFISENTIIRKPNFKMQNMFLSIPNIQAELVEVIQGSEKEKGLQFNLEYFDNQLKISNLTLNSFDGKILGENCNFLIGDLKPEKMEFEGRFLFRDIDLKQLISEKSRNSIEDGKLSGDINFYGQSLQDPLQNLDLYINIFKIGEDFGKSVIRVVRPVNLFLDIIISSYSQINKVDLNLSKGLVYSEIKFNRAILPTLLTSIQDNSLKQDRIPLANFLNRAKKEIGRYE